MKRIAITRPPNIGWLEVELDDTEIDYLWECIKKSGSRINDDLAGNISRSCELNDRGNWFFKNTLKSLCEIYKDEFRNLGESIGCSGRHPYHMEQWWVNYQKQNEFNPVHNHFGVYSFVIWMKIPTRKKDQVKNNEFARVTNAKVVSDFQFSYLDILGIPQGYHYEMNPEMEGRMLFFPSKLMHTVYPFYKCGKDRISISGNISLNTEKSMDSSTLKAYLRSNSNSMEEK